MKGKFITVEGLEGAGKSSAVAVIKESLTHMGIHRVLTTREPGGTPIAEELRRLCKTEMADEPWFPESELLLMYAARVQLVNHVIKPALSQGQWVIGDRHELSTRAYQGGGRGIEADRIEAIYDAVLCGFKPDLTFFLDVSPEMGLLRVDSRGARDRIEQESLAFFTRVSQAYHAYAKRDPSIIHINANQDMASVHQSIRQHMKIYLQS